MKIKIIKSYYKNNRKDYKLFINNVILYIILIIKQIISTDEILSIDYVAADKCFYREIINFPIYEEINKIDDNI